MNSMTKLPHQTPDWDYKQEYTEIIKDRVYVAGEDEVDDLLYGEDEARQINRHGTFLTTPVPKIDTWIDVRDIRESNRIVYLPNSIEWIQVPFRDGQLAEAEASLPLALTHLQQAYQEGKRILVTCHQGRSRSPLILLSWLVSEGHSFQDAYWMIKGKRPWIEMDKAFNPYINRLKEEKNLTNGGMNK